MNKLVLLIAAISLLPVALLAYFGAQFALRSPTGTETDGSAGNGLAAEGARVTIAAPDIPPPKVPGPVLRPSRLQGVIVTERLVPEKKPDRTYTVQPGDTLFDIAVRHYGDSTFVQEILRANPGLSAELIRVGEQITLPPKRAAEGGDGSVEKSGDEPRIYIVRRGDTLIGIARRLYGDAAMHEKIFQLNRDKLPTKDRIREGLVLKLPPPPSYD